MGEVDFLSNINACQRADGETVEGYFNMFNGNVARYVNQTAELNSFAIRQFAILMLRNEKLLSNTMNTVTFQLATNTSSKDAKLMKAEMVLDTSDLEIIIDAVTNDKSDVVNN